MTKKIVLSDDTSHLGYTLSHRTSRVGYKREDFNVLHLVRPDPSGGCDLADFQACATEFGCTLHTLDLSRLDEILEGDGLFDLFEYGERPRVKDPTKLVALLGIAAVHARKLGYETVILGGSEGNDHLGYIVNKFNETLVDGASSRSKRQLAFEVYFMD